MKTGISVLGVLSLATFILVKTVAETPLTIKEEMRRASSLMAEAAAALRACREAGGVQVDPAADVNRTGFIGLETSSITTSLGNLEAKRTTTNPSFAALVVLLLHQAGIQQGETVAIGASGSFPALIVAALCAARAMDVKPLLISSLGASQWGANDPRFDWLAMNRCLRQSGVLDFKPLALSLGGEGDEGKDMSPEGRAFLRQEAMASGFPLLDEPALEKNVSERLRLYQAGAGRAPIKAFINIGGGYANLGTDSEVLKVKPGLAAFSHLPPAERRGLIFAMAARGVPVIHLLYIKGLCDQYGLPWDPRPLPDPGDGPIYDRKELRPRLFWMIAAAYFVAVLAVLLVSPGRRGRRKGKN